MFNIKFHILSQNMYFAALSTYTQPGSILLLLFFYYYFLNFLFSQFSKLAELEAAPGVAHETSNKSHNNENLNKNNELA